MTLIEIRPKFAQINSEAPPCADITEIHAVVSRIFGEMKEIHDCFSDKYAMCELTFGEQCALVKTLVDRYMPDHRYALCKAVDRQAKQVRSLDCDAKSVVDCVLQTLLVEDVFFYIAQDLFLNNCNIFPLITQLATELTPLFRMVPRLTARFRKQCAVCARVPETVEESRDEDWDDSNDELLDENDKVLKTLLTEHHWEIYKSIFTYDSKTTKLEHQKRLLSNFQMQDLSAGVAGLSLRKRQDRDEDGEGAAGLDLGKRLRLRD